MMRNKFSVLTAAAMVLFGVVVLVPTAHADTNVVPDAGFRACLNGNLGQTADASITAAQLENLTGQMECSNEWPLNGATPTNISSIEGAQYLTGIAALDLSFNPIVDVSPLKGLTGVTELYLNDTHVSDLSALSRLTGLETLGLANDPVTTIAPLSGLVNLTTLNISNTQVTDLSPLTSLTSLVGLSLGTLPITDVTILFRVSPLIWNAEMAQMTATVPDGTSLNLPSPTEAARCTGLIITPGCPQPPMRTWSVQSGDVTIDGGRAMVSSVGTAVLTWVDSGGSGPSGSGTLTITATVSCNGFTDVMPTQWFFGPVCWLTDNNLTNGSNPAGTTFSPNDSVTRGQMAAFMYRAVGSPTVVLPTASPYADVATTNGFYKEIVWLKQQKLTNGSNPSGTMFSSDAAVTRGQMAAFMYRLANSPSANLPAISPFSDVATTNGFYKEIVWLQQEKITTGTNPAGTIFSPNDAVTRGQVAAFLQRLAATKLPCATYTDAIGC